MSDVTFATSTPAPIVDQPAVTPTETEPNLRAPSLDAEPTEPVESPMVATMNALGLGDAPSDLPTEAQTQLEDIGRYLESLIKSKGLAPTQESYARALEDLKWDMGLDPDAAPDFVIERLGGVIESWQKLTFLRDPRERRSVLMKLARAQSTAEMNKIVFDEMEAKSVWR